MFEIKLAQPQGTLDVCKDLQRKKILSVIAMVRIKVFDV